MNFEAQDKTGQGLGDSKSSRYLLAGHITKAHKLEPGKDIENKEASAPTSDEQARMATQALLQDALEKQKPTPLYTALYTLLPSEVPITAFYHNREKHKFNIAVAKELLPSISIDDTDVGSALVLNIQGACTYNNLKKQEAQGGLGPREFGNKMLGLGGGLLWGMGNEARKQWSQDPAGAVLEGTANAAIGYGLIAFEATFPHITTLTGAALLGTVIGHFLTPEQRANFKEFGTTLNQLRTANGGMVFDLMKQVARHPLNKEFYHFAYGLVSGATTIKPAVAMRAEMPSHELEQRAMQATMKFLAQSPKLAKSVWPTVKELPAAIQQFPNTLQTMLSGPFDKHPLATAGGKTAFMVKGPEPIKSGETAHAMSQLPENRGSEKTLGSDAKGNTSHPLTDYILKTNDDRVIFQGKFTSLKEAVEAAVREKMDLSGADLYMADLRETNLSGADLRGVNLLGADLRGANLRGTDLHGANLFRADLRGTDLRGANLRGTALHGADLSGAKFHDTNFGDIKTDHVYIDPLAFLPSELAGRLTNLRPWQRVAALSAYKRLSVDCKKAKDFSAEQVQMFEKDLAQSISKGRAYTISQAQSAPEVVQCFLGGGIDTHHAKLLLSVATTFPQDCNLLVMLKKLDPGTYRKALDRLTDFTKNAHKDSLPEIAQNLRNSIDPELRILKLASTFTKSQVTSWIEKNQKLGRDLNDFAYFLPLAPTSELAGLSEYLFRYVERPVTQLEVVSKNWQKLSAQEKKLPLEELLHRLSSLYQEVIHDGFARESYKHFVSPADYPAYARRFVASLDTPSPFPMKKQWQSDSLAGRFLPRDDARGLYLGQHTNCCQHPDNSAGAACAWYGQESPNSGFFVIENKEGKVIAQSWCWVSDDGGLCFDSIEGIREITRMHETAIQNIYQAAAVDLSKQFHTITAGTSHVDLSNWSKVNGNTLSLPSDCRVESDAVGGQVVLAHNPALPKQKLVKN